MTETNFREAYTNLCLSLKKIAEKNNVSQNQIAETTGFSQSNVNKILNGVYVTSVEKFLSLAKAIDDKKYNELLNIFNEI